MARSRVKDRMNAAVGEALGRSTLSSGEENAMTRLARTLAREKVVVLRPGGFL